MRKKKKETTHMKARVRVNDEKQLKTRVWVDG